MLHFPEEAHDVPMGYGEDVRTTDSGLRLAPFTLVFGLVNSPSSLFESLLRACSPCHEGSSWLVTWFEDDTVLVVVAPTAQVHLVVLATSNAQAYLFFIVFDRCIHIGRVDFDVRNVR